MTGKLGKHAPRSSGAADSARHTVKPSTATTRLLTVGGDIDWQQLTELRARFLALEGDAAIEIHGWLLGVACAVERQRGTDPRCADRLIAELRASYCGCSPQSSAVGDGLDGGSTPGAESGATDPNPQFTGGAT